MKKQPLLDKLDRVWKDFADSVVGLSDAQMLEHGVSGDWSVKDILAHVSWWEEEALKHLPTILQGGRPVRYLVKYGGIDAFNAQMTELKYGLALSDVRQKLDDTHNRLIEYLQTVPDEQFASGTRFLRRLRFDTYAHYPIHTQAIRVWQARSGSSRDGG
jgi:hypothetical protein